VQRLTRVVNFLLIGSKEPAYSAFSVSLIIVASGILDNVKFVDLNAS
jgi:hypothetical protein